VNQTKPLKIAYIIPSLDAGGAERFILDLIGNLDLSRFTPTLILFGHGGFFEAEARRLGIELVVLKERFKFDLINFFKLYIAVKRVSPDIVHTQLGGDIYGRLVAHWLRVPVIVSTEQNVQVGEPGLIRAIKAWTAKFADKIVAISSAVKSDIISRYGVPGDKVELIYNGLEVDRFWVETRRKRGQKKILGSMGRLTSQKNYALLFEALAQLKDLNWEFRLAGEGELRPELEHKIKDLGLTNRVHLLGLQRDVKSFFSDLDVFILPSLWEGLGIVLLEAGLAGLPVVASRVDGICEVIKEGETGILFNSNDQADLVTKLTKVLNQIDQPETTELGKKLQSDIKSRFDIKIIASEYQALYLKLLAKK